MGSLTYLIHPSLVPCIVIHKDLNVVSLVDVIKVSILLKLKEIKGNLNGLLLAYRELINLFLLYFQEKRATFKVITPNRIFILASENISELSQL